jgi:predicted permease
MVEELRARAAALPGVEIAAFSHVGQLSGGAIALPVRFPARAGPDGGEETTIVQRVSPGFLGAMGTPLIAGRDFLASDDEDAPLVAIVNESFARRFLPGEEPIGAHFLREGGSRSGQPIEIVGVAKDTKWVNLRDESPAMWYRPYRQMGGTPQVRLALRTSGEPELVAGALLRLARDVDKQISLSNVVPFRQVVDRALVIERIVAQVSTALGAVALLIAAVGLHGVVAHGVARRRREIGLRIALGARPGAIERMLVAEALTLVVLGAVLGILAATAVTRFVASMLFGLSPQDPASIGVAVGALAITTAGAAYLPARGAARTEPLSVLREE